MAENSEIWKILSDLNELIDKKIEELGDILKSNNEQFIDHIKNPKDKSRAQFLSEITEEIIEIKGKIFTKIDKTFR